MESQLFCEYRFKFYLNASHSVIINGRQGETHPHTWEYTLDILVARDSFWEFALAERDMEAFFSRYQNQNVNEIEPFDTVVPTLENMVDSFGASLREIVRENNGELLRIEGSETPTRSYIISYERTSDYLQNMRRANEESVGRMLDHLIDDATH